MSTLLLRLAGPMQSWGSSSLFDRRDTDDYPTKSGVIGILAGALGRKRGESLDDLRKLRFGVRIDAPGTRIDDFHITEMKNENETFKSNLSHRLYLSDAVFLAGLESDDDDFLQFIKQALLNPVYAPFLGRRSCPPSGPMVVGIEEEGLEEALQGSDWTVPKWRQKGLLRRNREISLRILVEDAHSQTLVCDNPVSFNPYQRKYSYRGIRECTPRTISAPKEENETDIYTTNFDPMQELV